MSGMENAASQRRSDPHDHGMGSRFDLRLSSLIALIQEICMTKTRLVCSLVLLIGASACSSDSKAPTSGHPSTGNEDAGQSTPDGSISTGKPSPGTADTTSVKISADKGG